MLMCVLDAVDETLVECWWLGLLLSPSSTYERPVFVRAILNQLDEG